MQLIEQDEESQGVDRRAIVRITPMKIPRTMPAAVGQFPHHIQIDLKFALLLPRPTASLFLRESFTDARAFHIRNRGLLFS